MQTKERSNTPVASSTPVHRGLTVWSLLPTPPPHAHLHSQCWLLLSVFIFSASFSLYLSYLYLSMHCKAAHFLPQALSVSLFTPTCILTHSQSKLRPLSAPARIQTSVIPIICTMQFVHSKFPTRASNCVLSAAQTHHVNASATTTTITIDAPHNRCLHACGRVTCSISGRQ